MFFVFLFSVKAQATIFDVNEIVITSALNDYLQVAEFTAFSGGFDYASTGNATTTYSSLYSSSYPGSAALDGNLGSFFHSANSSTPDWLSIEFNTVIDIDMMQIAGRSGYDYGRDIYNIELFNAAGSSLALFNGVNAQGEGYVTFYDKITTQNNPIPEPSILVLMGLGLIGLFSVNRRKV
ncbi:MAG: discoidin domain-containing protein [Gammaproteobacteria bacterium]|nr:discoidin domain-containing protein [Gammaproteobacteria bacterium]